MNLAEQVYQTVKPMPEALVQEVLDFALFLRQREESQEWRNLMLAQACSLADWDNAEDEVWTNAKFTDMSTNQAMRGMEDEPLLHTAKEMYQP